MIRLVHFNPIVLEGQDTIFKVHFANIINIYANNLQNVEEVRVKGVEFDSEAGILYGGNKSGTTGTVFGVVVYLDGDGGAGWKPLSMSS